VGCPEASLVAFLGLCVVLVVGMICVAWGSHSNPDVPGYYTGWRDVIRAVRHTAPPKRRWLLVLVLADAWHKRGGWAVLGIIAGAGFPAAGAICLDLPGVIRTIGEAVIDVLDSIAERFAPTAGGLSRVHCMHIDGLCVLATTSLTSLTAEGGKTT
jgi:hypothetical protein